MIIYHQACSDGFAAAWAAYHYRKKNNLDITLFPAKHGDSPPYAEAKDRDLILVDFCYPKEELEQLIKVAGHVMVLDHHKTNAFLQDFQGPKSRIVFDLNRSGAGIAWDTLHRTPLPTPRPWIIDYVEDRDLWRFKLPHSKAVNAFLHTLDFTIEAWDAASQVTKEDAVVAGTTILAYQEKEINKHLKWAYETELAGHKVLAVNATVYNSELANRLSEGRAFGVAWSMTEDGRYRYSLRNRGEKDQVDVTTIAALFGGGGHATASGFSSDSLVCPRLG